MGDADAVAATGLGIRNLERVADMLIPATMRPGEPFDDLSELYDRLIGQWALELNHVVPIVGGFSSQQKSGGQQGIVFTPVPRERQAAAVRFLNEKAFATPAFLPRTDILRRIEPSGVLDPKFQTPAPPAATAAGRPEVAEELESRPVAGQMPC